MKTGKPRWMLPGWVYVYRTRKPGAILGLPILGRHNGYTGQTRHPRARDIEHLRGGGRYNCDPKDWSDLKSRRYMIFYLPMCPQWLLNAVEILAIHLTLPVYNVQWNRWNPRRIKPATAALQRVMRDRNPLHWSPNLTGGPIMMAGFWACLSLAGWIGGWW